MFCINGKPSGISEIVTAFLENSGLPFYHNKEHSLTCTVYRRDPLELEDYLFITAMLGIKQMEPMFGPLVFDDLRCYKEIPNKLGFIEREKTKWYHEIKGNNWRIYLSGRMESEDEFNKELDNFKSRLYKPLDKLFETQSDSKRPIFQELENSVLRGFEKLWNEFQHLTPNAPIQDVVQSLSQSIIKIYNGKPFNFHPEIRIYLNTDENWTSVGQPRIPNLLPTEVKHIHDKEYNPEDLNAFQWVDKSTRPVIIRPKKGISSMWRNRIVKCGEEMENALTQEDFSGMCIVPLLDPHQHSHSMGLIVLASKEKEVAPAHLFLLSRLASNISLYLSPFLPLPGYPRWIPIDHLRDQVEVIWDESITGITKQIVEKFTKELMPEKSSVTINPLHSGKSGSHVFRLDVHDKYGLLEIPRVIKIGPINNIKKELRSYYNYVANKSVEGSCRLDTTKAIFKDEDYYGALVYVFVGGVEEKTQAQPWSQWASKKDFTVISQGLDMLKNQLKCWYFRSEQSNSSAIKLLIKKPFFDKQHFESIEVNFSNPDKNEVKNVLKVLCEKDSSITTKECIVHGDIHAGNIFSIIDENKKLLRIALIDWGSVSKRHPLSDITKLMADLLYKVRWSRNKKSHDDMKKFAFEKLEEWGSEFSEKDDWKIAFMHQLVKMLFYSLDDKRTSYFTKTAREQAWKDIKELINGTGN